MLTIRIHILENCCLLGYVAVWTGRSVPTFPTNLFNTSFTLMMEPTGFTEMSVHFHCSSIHSATSQTTSRIYIVTAVGT
jgi:hypothetical protein